MSTNRTATHISATPPSPKKAVASKPATPKVVNGGVPLNTVKGITIDPTKFGGEIGDNLRAGLVGDYVVIVAKQGVDLGVRPAKIDKRTGKEIPAGIMHGLCSSHGFVTIPGAPYQATIYLGFYLVGDDEEEE